MAEPQRMRLTTRSQVEQWFVERNWFFDGHVFSAAQHQTGTGVDVVLRLGEMKELGLVLGTEQIFDVYEVRAIGSVGFVGIELQPEYFSEGVEMLETNSAIGFSIDCPGELEVLCEALEVQYVGSERTEVTPWIGESEVSLTALGDLPSAEFWRQSAERLSGSAIVWRTLAGPADSPTAGYEGWFLEQPEKLDHHDGGVMCQHAAASGGGEFTVAFSVWRERNDAVWTALLRTLGGFEGRVSIGNCTFTTSDWLAFLDSGELPPYERLS